MKLNKINFCMYITISLSLFIVSCSKEDIYNNSLLNASLNSNIYSTKEALNTYTMLYPDLSYQPTTKQIEKIKEFLDKYVSKQLISGYKIEEIKISNIGQFAKIRFHGVKDYETMKSTALDIAKYAKIYNRKGEPLVYLLNAQNNVVFSTHHPFKSIIKL